MRTIAAAIVVALSCSASARPYVDDLGDGPRYRLYFPPFKRVETDASSGRVTAITLTIRCGYITGISQIPGDWWIQMRGPISGETTFFAEAGHGASYLWKLETWNGSITITPYDMSCFDVSASVMTDAADNEQKRVLVYTRKQLKLRQ
jgi:hypothetical protein